MRCDVAVARSAGTPVLFRVLPVVLALLLAWGADDASARLRKEKSGGYAPPVAAMVLDPVSGEALYELDADGPRHPASLTKVMTLFLLFEDLEAGKVTMDTPFVASWKAINQAPSRLGLQKGETITVEDAIRAVVTKSANDVAEVIAENVGGSEQAFVERMNSTAWSLGMKKTTFFNPTGLPDTRQVTTARDLVILGKAIRDRFPTLFSYFQTKTFDYGGRTILSHNRLMQRLAGMDGIKTGFTNASGFNLLASVRRDRQSVIAVVIGGSTAKARDTRMAELVERYLPEAQLAPVEPPPPPPVAQLDDRGLHLVKLEGEAGLPALEVTGSIVTAQMVERPLPPRGLIWAMLVLTGLGVVVRLHPRLRLVGWIVAVHGVERVRELWDEARLSWRRQQPGDTGGGRALPSPAVHGGLSGVASSQAWHTAL